MDPAKTESSVTVTGSGVAAARTFRPGQEALGPGNFGKVSCQVISVVPVTLTSAGSGTAASGTFRMTITVFTGSLTGSLGHIYLWQKPLEQHRGTSWTSEAMKWASIAKCIR